MSRKGVLGHADLVDRVAATGADVTTLAQNWAGQAQISARIGDKSGPPVVVLAGSHGPEFHGVNAALRLIDTLETTCDVHIVPAVDPLGVESLESAMSLAFGLPVSAATHDEARATLRSSGDVFFEAGSLLIAGTDDVAFFVADPGPMDYLCQCLPGHGYESVISAVGRLIEADRGLKETLRDKRLLTPSNFFFDGIGPLEHLYQCIQLDAWSVYPGFKDLASTYPFPSPPVEVQAIKDLMDAVRPHLLLDLHGGYGTKCYFYTSYVDADDDLRRSVGAAMSGAVQRAGHPVNETADELKAITRNWDSRFSLVSPGLAMHFYPFRSELAVNYFERYGLTYMIEPALDNSYETAVEMHMLAVTAAIREIETRKGR